MGAKAAYRLRVMARPPPRCCRPPTDLAISDEVRDWCATSTDGMRVILCGYDGEHDDLLGVGWSVIDGKSGSGAGYSTNSANGRRERLWLSPECISAHQDVLDFTEATA